MRTKAIVAESDALTDREREGLTAVSRGLSNAEIAQELIMSRATAKTHVSRLLTKLDSRARAHAGHDCLRNRDRGSRRQLTDEFHPPRRSYAQTRQFRTSQGVSHASS